MWNAHAYTYGDTNADSYADGDAHTDANAHSHSDGYGHANADADSNSYSHGDFDADTDAYSHAQTYADAQAAADASSAGVTLSGPLIGGNSRETPREFPPSGRRVGHGSRPPRRAAGSRYSDLP
jgi:hypothetical protein